MRDRHPPRTEKSSRRRFAALSVIVIVAAVTIAGGIIWRRGRPAVRSGACRNCNVLLITIDTLRLDRVGAFGGPAGLTPHLDRLASEGLRLTRTYSSAPLTLPSHASIMTAVSPPVHGVRTNGLFRLGAVPPTLATVLKSAGYRTGAFVGAFVLDARFGLNRGFDVYDDRYGEKHTGDPTEGAERRAEDVIKPATAWIVQPSALSPQPSSSPWFAWVHLYDPHEPYRAPEPYASQHEPYDAEVAYADAMVGRLLDDLQAAHQLDRTLVVVASDHGESLGEHGERTHGVFVYDVTMRVPWIVWAGSRLTSASTDALVRLIDVAPTTLDLVGVAAPSSFEGRSVLPEVGGGTWFGQAGAGRTAYIEAMDANLTRNWAPLTGIVSGGAKFIELPIPELYDLSSDPKEATNLFTRDAERARTLGALLREATSALLSRGSAAEKTTLSGDARQRLQALGYVASSAEAGNRVFTDADDPKNLIGLAEELSRAVIDFSGGARAQAMAAVRTIVRNRPTFTTAVTELASMQRQTGDLPGAIATLDTIARQGVADSRVLLVLAAYLDEAGQSDRSLALIDAVIAARPDDAEAYNSLGVVEMRRGRHDRAQAAFRRVLDLDPTSATAYANLGVDDLAVRDLPAAIDDLKQAVTLDTRHYTALYNLAIALHDAGRRDEARPLLERFVQEAPPAQYASDIAHVRALLAIR
ncbi:MAG: sulfatase-like hydrolase/transferase [Acidobacteria bacterium]|nr:sulfatase-like hydrolase/transferase [Acidobacteriota bacterium]